MSEEAKKSLIDKIVKVIEDMDNDTTTPTDVKFFQTWITGKDYKEYILTIKPTATL